MLGLGQLFKNFNDLANLAKDENFKKFFNDPRVQDLMADEDFKRAFNDKNMFKIASNPKFNKLIQDPEIRQALTELAEKQKKS